MTPEQFVFWLSGYFSYENKLVGHSDDTKILDSCESLSYIEEILNEVR